jgi:hypothetical protein
LEAVVGGGSTRSLTVAPGQEREALERGDLPKVDLCIEFEPNSDRLTAPSKQVLAALAEALKRPELGSNRFAIVGHTDGRGSEQYNQQLSERRAAAVKGLSGPHHRDRGIPACRHGVRQEQAAQSVRSARRREPPGRDRQPAVN